MKKSISYLCILLMTAGLAACAKAPATGNSSASVNSPEQQRANSRDAQGELSTDVKR